MMSKFVITGGVRYIGIHMTIQFVHDGYGL
mgnify:CR=1 FL=1